jgi:CMP-N-acetylneuraminic acid synthetase
MKKIKVVIPVRQGSERIKNKNFKSFGGKSLLEHKIDIVKNLPVDDIIVNTDSEYAIEIAKRERVNYHKRDKYYASSECPNSEHHIHMAEVTDSEYTMIASVTSPLIKLETYIEALDIFNNITNDSLVSVNCIQDYLWYNGKPLNYSLDNDLHSQQLPKYYKPTFGIVIFKNSEVSKNKNWLGGNPYFYEVSDIESIDIDNDIDFEFAEFLFNK